MILQLVEQVAFAILVLFAIVILVAILSSAIRIIPEYQRAPPSRLELIRLRRQLALFQRICRVGRLDHGRDSGRRPQSVAYG